MLYLWSGFCIKFLIYFLQFQAQASQPPFAHKGPASGSSSHCSSSADKAATLHVVVNSSSPSSTASNRPSQRFVTSIGNIETPRAVASGGAGGAIAPPVFGQTVNPISTKGADYTHHSTTSPPGISDLATGLHVYGKICNGNFITGPYWNDSYNLFSSKICFTLHFSVHQMVAYNIILELMVVFKLSILMEIDICVTKIIEFAFVKKRVSRSSYSFWKQKWFSIKILQ